MRPLHIPGGSPVPVEVDCYAGFKGDERPVRIRAGGSSWPVEAILDQWYGPAEACFRIRAGGGTFLLRRHVVSDAWTLEQWRVRARQEES